MADDERFEAACRAFEAAHREDPRTDDDGVPYSVRYHERVSAWVERLEPDASVAVRLAARAQHLRRWTIPRSQYPAGRAGYKRWRSELARMHAEQASQVLDAAGYDTDVVRRVGDLLIKKRLKSDPEVQLLEDAVCLTFLELEYAEFSTQHPPDKVVSILRKTWDKMSPRGHQAALQLVGQLPAPARALVERALGADPPPMR